MGNQDGTITAVLKVDLHCEGCAEKVKKSVKGFEGVERVKADVGGGKLTVSGKVDPSKLRDRLAAKTHKQVNLLRPTVTPGKGAKGKDGSEKPTAEEDRNVSCEKICKHGCSTVVLDGVPLHCEDCIARIKKLIYNFKGVRCVTVDAQKHLVTVTGNMDAEALLEVLKCKLGPKVAFLLKDDAGEKKEKGGEKKEKGGDKKEKPIEKDTGAGGGGKDDGAKAEANRASCYVGYTAGAGGGANYGGAKALAERAGYYYPGYTHRIEILPAPELFSDENPNACSVM